ncbi:MAG TPA: CBASS cGAMP-activated phospholipase [Saprospiraceae bacterium]|nr:CBASS cGAMP-activated phospholipase [Saprospiraceae bacterium]HMU03029.1 CBASS cGAMP-activated phospholipase [Saprospiraceae bacterium]
MNNKKFKILSIDGGGIRGIFAAMFLVKLESSFKEKDPHNWQIYQKFDLVSGTSTGGIIALALSLGIPAVEIYNLYYENAKHIFNSSFFRRLGILRYKYERKNLQELIRIKFAEYNNNIEPRMIDCKVPVCIPIYDLQEGEPSIIKSKYHESFNRDFHIPVYMVALATSAAPTYFKPYSSAYIDLNDVEVPFRNKVDGGVYCNNPTLTAIIEAQTYFDKDISELQVLSIGTGHQKFTESNSKKKVSKFGILYWINPIKKRLIDLFFQGQSQQTQNLIKLISKNNQSSSQKKFEYFRIDSELDNGCTINLDETNPDKLDILSEKAVREFQKHGHIVTNTFIN